MKWISSWIRKEGKMNENRRIIIKPEDKEFLKRMFDCSISQVYKAVRFENNGLTSRKIRSYAMNFLKCYLI